MANRKPRGVPAERTFKDKERQEKAHSPEAEAKRKESREINKAVKTGVYESLRSIILEPNGKGKTYYQEFLAKYLAAAKADPSSKAAEVVAKTILKENILESLDEQTDKYLARDVDFNEFRLLKTLYDKQRNVFLDADEKKIIIGSRRIGKTELAARLLVKECLRPNRHALFISLKFENAIRQCYTLVEDLIDKMGIPVERKSKAEGEITFANGSYILFKGNANKAEAAKLLGYKYSLAVIDEVQNQCNLRFLLDDVLRPTMVDYEDSHLILIGTPPRTPKTLTEQIWKEWKGWKKYSWDMTDNPYIKNVEKVIDDICKEKGITPDDPFIKREYRGQFFYDTEAMVYKGFKTYEPTLDFDLPNNGFVPTHVVTGCDWGYNDYNSFITLAYNKDTREAYVIKEQKFNKTTVSDIIERCVNQFQWSKEWFIKHNNKAEINNCYLVCDTNEKSLLYELSVKYKLPAFSAYKYDKDNAIATLVDYCRTNLYIPKNGILNDEMERTVYKRDEEDNILNEIDDDTFHPDALDALLYASRQYNFDVELHPAEPEVEQYPNVFKGRTHTLPENLRDFSSESDNGGVEWD